MNVVQWNVSKVSGPSFGTAKYEEKLYDHAQSDLDRIRRTQRRDGSLLGNMPISWFERFRRGDHDLVHATFQTVAPASFFHPPKKFVVTVHDLAPIVYPSEIRDYSLKLQWRLTPAALRRADRIIAISEFTKSEINRLMGISPKKITVVRQGIDHDLYYPRNRVESRVSLNIDPNSMYILVVSSDLEHKRVEVAKQIIERVRRERPNAKILKAGYGQQLEGDHVVNTGWVSEADMPKLYSAADVYLHPSEYEGFGLPVLEAMACGTPVVARDVASIPEIVGDTTDLVPHDASVQTFADRILEQMRRNPPLSDLVDRSREFSWKKTAVETKEVYESVME